ncbi:uncharacterized protein K441DRAFT_589943, partial [Cenococcum geophilum 1.58]|uniref:uncharacterized protein n=1 Tax=Cenococcum geophilum 1.58 TaxID=794803 RepID=UPI000DC991C3
ILDIIGEYKIRGRIWFFMLNNALSNDIAVNLILKTLYIKMSVKQRKRYELQCLSYIVNLCA